MYDIRPRIRERTGGVLKLPPRMHQGTDNPSPPRNGVEFRAWQLWYERHVFLSWLLQATTWDGDIESSVVVRDVIDRWQTYAKTESEARLPTSVSMTGRMLHWSATNHESVEIQREWKLPPIEKNVSVRPIEYRGLHWVNETIEPPNPYSYGI